MKVYQAIASSYIAYINCIRAGNEEWMEKHDVKLHKLINKYLPSGSGWDNGTSMSWDEDPNKELVFFGGFHHMDEHGGYKRWTDHSIVVKPSWDGISLKVTGQNYNDIKEYLADLFYHALTQEIENEQS